MCNKDKTALMHQGRKFLSKHPMQLISLTNSKINNIKAQQYLVMWILAAKVTYILTEETFPEDELLSSDKGVCSKDF